MPKKKGGGSGDADPSAAQSFLKPVPQPSSFAAWKATQLPAATPADLQGYVPVGDFRRDYVFLCQRLGISVHPSIVERIRRPMSE
jgi:hypothetical protein